MTEPLTQELPYVPEAERSPDEALAPMDGLPATDASAPEVTDAEYQQVVHGWIGIPYRLNGQDRATGLDCRTLCIQFLRAQGVAVKDTDSEPLPETIDVLDLARYEAGVKAAGQAVELKDLRRNDVVYYKNKVGRLHVGIWIGYDRILTTGQAHGSHLYRIRREQLLGAVRGARGVWLDVSPLEVPPGRDPITLALVGGVVGAGLVGGAGVVATIVGFGVGFAVVGAISFGIGALTSGRQAFDFDGSAGAGLDASPRYAFDGARNIRSNQYPVPLIYAGLGIRVLNTLEIWNSGQGAQTQRRLVVIGEGELGGITEVQLNGSPIANFAGSSAVIYLGTTSQWANLPAEVPGMKNVAGLDLTLAASEKLSGDPVITCKVTGGRKIKTWNGTIWTGATASGNPAAIIRDYLTLTRERGGCGFPENALDDASFGAVYDYCEATVTNLDGTTEARARLDMIIDTFRPWLDTWQDLMATFGAFPTSDGRKFSLRVEKSESAVQAFTEHNVTEVEYQTFSKDDRPNRIIGVYIDPTTDGNDARTRVSVDDLVDQAKNPRGLVPREVNLLGLSRQTQAIREVTKVLNDLRANWYAISFVSDVEAIALEAGDVFTITHPVLGDGVTAYSFRAIRILEMADHKRRIIGKAYTAGVFNDQMEQQAVVLDYTPPPNPFTPVADVTGLTATAVGFLQVDGSFVSNLQVAWTEPADKINLKMYTLEWGENGGAYVERDNVFPGATSAILPGAKIGATYTVRVKTVSKVDVRSDGAISASVVPNGDTAPPLDVAGFDVQQRGDEIRLSWNGNPDLDIWGYEIREGGTTWESAAVIDTVVSGSRYTIRDFSGGTKTYRIKAIDASLNYSVNAASDSLIATAPGNSNILFKYDVFKNGLKDGVFSAGAELQTTADFAPAYFRPAIGLKTILRVDTYASTYTQLETDLNWDTEQRETTLENYTSEAVDIGSIQTAICSIAHKEIVPSGTVTIEWAKSDTDPNPSTFVAFTEGIYTIRYFKIRIKVQTTDTTKNVRVYECNFQMDVKDQEETGTNVAIAAGGTTITFAKSFSQTPNIQVSTVGASAFVPVITAQSSVSFTVKLWDSNAVPQAFVAGNVNWRAKGF